MAVFNITNTHARVLQGAVVHLPKGGLGLYVGIRYNHALREAPDREWTNMLCWGLWSLDEDDESEGESDGEEA